MSTTQKHPKKSLFQSILPFLLPANATEARQLLVAVLTSLQLGESKHLHKEKK